MQVRAGEILEAKKRSCNEFLHLPSNRPSFKGDFETVIIITHNYATLKHIPTETHECKDPVTRKQTKKVEKE